MGGRSDAITGRKRRISLPDLDSSLTDKAAKVRGGVYTGRKPTAPVDKVRELHAAGVKPTAIAKATGMSRMHVYRLTKAEAVLAGA